MRFADRGRPRTTARRFGRRPHRGPLSRAARYLLLACCLPLGTLGGMALLAGPAEAAGYYGKGSLLSDKTLMETGS